MNPPLRLRQTWQAAGIALCLACQACSPSPPAPKGASYASVSELGATTPIPEAVELNFDTPPSLRVQAETVVEGDEMTILLTAFGEVLERERYRFGATEFTLVEAAGESYKPALPLMQFPFTVGSAWKWEGDVLLGERPIPAMAKISSETDSVTLEGFDGEAVRINVALSIESGGPNPAERTLTFWFVPGKGILKREFGKASSRMPAPLEVPEEPGEQ